MFDGIEFVDAFGADYTAAIARERPSNSSREFAFAREGHRVQDGLLIRVVPREAKPWHGMFASGDGSLSNPTSGMFAAPDPNGLFVVSYGNGYLVDVRTPESYSALSAWITHVVPVPEAKILLIADPWSLYGIRGTGIVWEQDVLHVDGFTNIRSDGPFVEAVAHCGANGDLEIRVDARTGELVREFRQEKQ
jgi:hypothetical protein